MKFCDFLSEMTEQEQEDYAIKCGTSYLYLRNHLKVASRIPRPKLMRALWENSGGKVSREELHDHFLPISEAAA